jgi:hypothetical protein
MNLLRLVLVLGALGPAVASAQIPEPPHDRFQDFIELSLTTPGPHVLHLGAALLDQLGNYPEEWQGSSGFPKRLAGRYGFGFTSDAVGHSAAALFHHRVRYEPCSCAGGWRRTFHALGRGFVTRHDEGHLTLHTSIFIAKFSAAGIANAWYPASYTGGDMLREGVLGVGINAALNIAREFGPELMRLVPFR